MDRYHKDGSIIFSGMFKWWADFGLLGIFKEEMDMYMHHQRWINGRPNYGWLRTMVYGLSQQLLRQDPVYYRAYVLCRPDLEHRLVSYPYYCKYAKQGDSTAFKHIDVNIPRLLKEGRGANMIHGSLSLEDERPDNCTIMLHGMQHHLGAWWDDLKARGLATDGFVHKFEARHFTEADKEKFKVDWVDVPCKAGDVRISLPHLPYGSHGPCKATRRTLLPWYVALQEDLKTLEVEEGGQWEELATAHRDLVAPPRTPSGLANMYGRIPFAFPAAVPLTGISPLSDVLVCQRKWDNTNLVNTAIRDWRRRAAVLVKEKWEQVQRLERKAFGTKSYFYCKEMNREQPAPDEPTIQEELAAKITDKIRG